jgi:hypothetical protein
VWLRGRTDAPTLLTQRKQTETGQDMIPTPSQTSQKCLRMFSKLSSSYFVQVRRQCPHRARGYATSTSLVNTKNTATGPPKSTKAARNKIPGQISASGARLAPRAAQAQAEQEKAKANENADPDSTIQQITQLSSIHPGIDVWANDLAILGTRPFDFITISMEWGF